MHCLEGRVARCLEVISMEIFLMCKDETQVKLLLKKLHNFRPLLQEMLQVIEGWIRSVKFNTYIHIFFEGLYFLKKINIQDFNIKTKIIESLMEEEIPLWKKRWVGWSSTPPTL